jgi:hypothetical protein
VHLVAAYINHLTGQWIRALIHRGGNCLKGRAYAGQGDDDNDRPESDTCKTDEHTAPGPSSPWFVGCRGGLNNGFHIQPLS